MKVVETTATALDDYRQRVDITIDGKLAFSVHDGEPEDNNMGRNFSDCDNVTNLMKQAHSAGLEGEALDFEFIQEEW